MYWLGKVHKHSQQVVALYLTLHWIHQLVSLWIEYGVFLVSHVCAALD